MGNGSSSSSSSPAGRGGGPGASPGSKLPIVRVGDLRPGDCVLMRQPVATTLGALDPGLVRSLAATQRGNYFSAQQQRLAGWTHSGIIVLHKDKPYLVMPSMHGIELFPAAKRIRRLQKAGTKVAVRQLNVAMTDATSRVLTDLLQAAVYGCEWERYMPEVTSDPIVGDVLNRNHSLHLPRSLASAAGFTPGSRSPVATDPSIADRFAVHAGDDSSSGTLTARSATMARTWGPNGPDSATTTAASPDHRIPAIRIGGTPAALSADVSGMINSERSRQSATASTRSDLTPFAREFIRMLMPRVWAALASVPPQMEVELRRAFRRADAKNTGSISIGEVQQVLQDFRGTPISKPEADSFVRLMDLQGDQATLDDFLAALARRPIKEIPLEHDLTAILCGEFVATLYELMGLLPTRTATNLRTPHGRRPSLASSLMDDRASGGLPSVSPARSSPLPASKAEPAGKTVIVPQIDFSEKAAPLDLSGSKPEPEVAAGTLSSTYAALNMRADSKLGDDTDMSPRAARAFQFAVVSHGSLDNGSVEYGGPPQAAVPGEMRRLVTSSDIATLLSSPKNAAQQPVIMTRHRLPAVHSSADSAVGAASTNAGPASLSGHSGESTHELTAGAPVRSAYDGVIRSHSPATPPIHVDGIAGKSRAHSAVRLSNASGVRSATVVPALPSPPTSTSSGGGYPSGRPPPHSGSSMAAITTTSLHTHSMSPTALAFPGLGSRKVLPPTPHGTIVIIDSACGDLRHFTPMTFSSHFEPKVRLLRGRLEPEALIETSRDDDDLDHAKQTVKALSGAAASATPKITLDSLMTTRSPGGATAVSSAMLTASGTSTPGESRTSASTATRPTPMHSVPSSYVIDITPAK